MRTSAQSRLERLEILKSRLKSGDVLTIASLAGELTVSVRTISRDIDLLRTQGVPVEADRGRGGGVRLQAQWGVGRINFNYSEAVDLMITLAIAQQMNSSFFMANLDKIRRKLEASFSPQMKLKVRQLKHRILITPSASIDVLSSFTSPSSSVAENLHQAFLMQQRIRMQYKAKSGEVTMRCIEPHFLLLSYPVWYVLAWDELRQDIRTFRCDRISKICSTEEEFRLLPVSHFEASLEGADII